MMFLYEYEVFLLLSDNETCTIGQLLSAENVVAALPLHVADHVILCVVYCIACLHD